MIYGGRTGFVFVPPPGKTRQPKKGADFHAEINSSTDSKSQQLRSLMDVESESRVARLVRLSSVEKKHELKSARFLK